MKSLFLVVVFGCFMALAAARSAKISHSITNNRPEIFRLTRSSCFKAKNILNHSQYTGLWARHNQKRGQVNPTPSNMVSLDWDFDLAAMAQWSANQCVFEHNNQMDCQGNKVGQNTFIATDEVTRLYHAVDHWYSEVKDFNYTSNSCKQNKTCSHYTQVVWATTQAVGCGYKRCARVLVNGDQWSYATLVFCNYRKRGNIANFKPYQAGPACSVCVMKNALLCHENTCINCIPKQGLYPQCICRRICRNGGTLDAGTCTCTCPKPYWGPTCAAVCEDKHPEACSGIWKHGCDMGLYYKFMSTWCPKECNYCEA